MRGKHEAARECSENDFLTPEIGAIHGPNNTSEAAQAERIVDRLPSNALVLADSAFGIFRVAYRCHSLGKEFVFRLTSDRFRSYQKRSTLVESGPGFSTWRFQWSPSLKEQKSNPHLPKDALLEVFVHQITLDNGEDLYLISNVEADAQSSGRLYQRRYDVEFDIRDLKVTMDTENIRARHLDTVLKELLGSVIAYNLVTQFRRQAAKLAKITPRRLSFKGVWLSFTHHLLYARVETLAEWEKIFTTALISASRRRLPNRPKPRSYPRAAHPRRPKTTGAQKAQRRNKRQIPDS